ncbi:hypothetical protein CEY16_12005 [Halalkalibacillus sediminis]|uniref:HD-GYP domain-containing protein n=1 Tax=Halalkalibacillus sediminis TaxID=2018042 RepID=A0A2I0QSX4_9BACI|nr:HD-GYP domain-containing protein [Halalkalibacillus sediminis]PKR77445.1 hypothetical protein CEY16_12005 [Halalkalibacillus sediminis]
MRVHPKQLIPGCLILKDVMGKTVHPIIPRNSVVEPIHISVLHKFQVPYVEVATKLVNGDPFKVDTSVEAIEKEDQEKQQEESETVSWSFFDYYVDRVKKTKELFEGWNKQSTLNISYIRELLFPLIQIGENLPKVLLELHHYTNKQDYFFHHIVATPVIAAFLAKKMKYDKNERFQIALAAYLSDLGMLMEEKHLYFKDGVLTEEEYERVQKHPILSYRLIDDLPYVSKNVKLGVLQHHERLDGSGYPLGVMNEKIHPFAKIIAVSDIFHAMTSERFYRKKQSPFKVIEELLNRQFGKLDMKIVDTLVDSIVFFSSGTKVRISNNETGTIVFIDQKNPTRPLIRLDSTQEIFNLNEHSDLYIDEVLMKD